MHFQFDTVNSNSNTANKWGSISMVAEGHSNVYAANISTFQFGFSWTDLKAFRYLTPIIFLTILVLVKCHRHTHMLMEDLGDD
ncbi:hypothetical protein BDZ91DRAFT_152003 [Kalaharituber pfeilii]|nr:hypothetical protein BDZ91DRAFT_152003 [Kalaharituber pfeilii]